MLVENRRARWGLAPGILPYTEPSMDQITIQLAPGEVLALYSFLALGAHFAAVVSRENSPFSLSENKQSHHDPRRHCVEYSHRQTGRSRRGRKRAGAANKNLSRS